MNICKTEENIRKLADNFNEATFIYDLLLAYGKPKASITRLQKSYNLSKRNNELFGKKIFVLEELTKTICIVKSII